MDSESKQLANENPINPQTLIKQLEEQESYIGRLLNEKIKLENILKRVIDQPKLMSHRVMVPFGKVALFPAKIIRTNEFLYQHGTEMFSAKTAYQVFETGSRKIELLTKLIEELRTNVQNIRENLGDPQNYEPPVEIKEKVDTEKYKNRYHNRVAHTPKNVHARTLSEPIKKLKSLKISQDDSEQKKTGKAVSFGENIYFDPYTQPPKSLNTSRDRLNSSQSSPLKSILKSPKPLEPDNDANIISENNTKSDKNSIQEINRPVSLFKKSRTKIQKKNETQA